MFPDYRKINWKKVSLQSILGGVAAYAVAKQNGLDERTSIALGVVSAVTSGGSATVDTRKKAGNNGKSDEH
jgi:hypothetical protein